LAACRAAGWRADRRIDAGGGDFADAELEMLSSSCGRRRLMSGQPACSGSNRVINQSIDIVPGRRCGGWASGQRIGGPLVLIAVMALMPLIASP